MVLVPLTQVIWAEMVFSWDYPQTVPLGNPLDWILNTCIQTSGYGGHKGTHTTDGVTE